MPGIKGVTRRESRRLNRIVQRIDDLNEEKIQRIIQNPRGRTKPIASENMATKEIFSRSMRRGIPKPEPKYFLAKRHARSLIDIGKSAIKAAKAFDSVKAARIARKLARKVP